MIKFFKSHDPDNRFDVSDVLMQLPNDSTLEDVCDTFERFLLACSFSFNGRVRITGDEVEE